VILVTYSIFVCFVSYLNQGWNMGNICSICTADSELVLPLWTWYHQHWFYL